MAHGAATPGRGRGWIPRRSPIVRRAAHVSRRHAEESVSRMLMAARARARFDMLAAHAHVTRIPPRTAPAPRHTAPRARAAVRRTRRHRRARRGMTSAWRSSGCSAGTPKTASAAIGCATSPKTLTGGSGSAPASACRVSMAACSPRWARWPRPLPQRSVSALAARPRRRAVGRAGLRWRALDRRGPRTGPGSAGAATHARDP